MDFSKVKLIVSDMDGTLLNTQGKVSSRFFKQFKQLNRHNLHFVAASGRQYHSIIKVLFPIKNDISIIAENGGVLALPKQDISVLLKLSRNEITETITTLRSIKNCYVVLCGVQAAYIETNNQKFISEFKKYYTEYKIVEDLTQVENDDFLKIAVFHFKSSESCIAPHLKPLSNNLKMVVSGENWLDISHKSINKGFALKKLQNQLNISPSETLVFGDYNNDLQMLKLGNYSYAMENAHSEVKKVARFTTHSNKNQGVENVLDKVIQSYL